MTELVSGWVPLLQNSPPGDATVLGDLCYTASVRRSHYPNRAAFVGATAEEILSRLRVWLENSRVHRPPGKAPGPLVFVFSGHGSQWVGMGASLLEREPAFREAMTRCDDALRSVCGWSVINELIAPAPQFRLDRTEYFQPVLFAIQSSLAALWRSWGIVPGAVVGHSVGEIAAAYVAGAISLEDAARIAARRGQLMQSVVEPGAMAAAELSAEEARKFIEQRGLKLTVAAINGPRSVTLSGHPEAVDGCLRELTTQAIPGRRLQVDRAFHSAAMLDCADALSRELAGLNPKATSVPFYSTVEGGLLEGNRLDSTYWGRNIREPVQFAAAVGAVLSKDPKAILEISPHPVLASSLRQCLDEAGAGAAVLPSLRRGQEERGTLLTSLGALYELGVEIQWRAVYARGGRRVSLPAYPWQRERHWVTSSHTGGEPGAQVSEAQWPGRVLRSAFFDGTVIECEISTTRQEFINAHRVCGVATVPATAMIDLALLAGRRELSGENGVIIESFAIERPLFIQDQERRTLQSGFKPGVAEAGSFELFSRAVSVNATDSAWIKHATGTVRRATDAEVVALGSGGVPGLDQARAECNLPLHVAEHYELMGRRGVDLGTMFRGVEKLWHGAHACL
ncbi:MAG TPA: acyltransferase domain-containing protein, partial [Verrucomicrobiae bacterium]|nr:acyltransferase domain-containing protein [Verrucomicrobiae bacterium]